MFEGLGDRSSAHGNRRLLTEEWGLVTTLADPRTVLQSLRNMQRQN